MSIDIKASREMCEKATPGPWDSFESDLDGGGSRIASNAERPGVPSWWDVLASVGSRLDGHHKANAAFIAHARTALPAALYEIERLRSALTIARQGLRDCRYAATPAQADEWATDALLRSSIEEHLAETDTGGES